MTSVFRQTLRLVLERANLFDRATGYLFNVAVKYYERRSKSDPALQDQVIKLQGIAPLESHYGHTLYKERHAVLNLALYLAQVTLNLGLRLKLDDFNPEHSTVLDAGDPDGLVLQSISARRGVSLNILNTCARQVKSAGGCSVQGDCERLPFCKDTFDYVICFETLEHLENPIQGLRELGRVCRKKLFISIPWVRNTTIHEDNYQKDQPEPENHIFEFCPRDFTKIVTHTPFEISYHRTIEMFPKISNPFHFFLLHQFYFPGFFPRFQFYELTKKKICHDV